MNRPRLIRGIKIAWSAFCGLAVVLMIVLWMRSYRGCDVIYWQTTITRTTLSSATGVIGIYRATFESLPGWAWNTIELMPVGGPVRTWEFRSDNSGTHIRFPHRLPILMFAIFAAGPWLREFKWRFTL